MLCPHRHNVAASRAGSVGSRPRPRCAASLRATVAAMANGAHPPRAGFASNATELPQRTIHDRANGNVAVGRGERAGARTRDLVIKSHPLYHLSYALAGGARDARRATRISHRRAWSIEPAPQPAA